MEEIDLKELLLFFIKKIKIIIIVTVLVIVAGLGYSLFFKKPLYSGDVTIILVSKSNGVVGSDTQSDVSLNQKLVSTYTNIVKSRAILKQVKENLNLDYSIDTLSSMISVSSVETTEIIKISVSDNDPDEAVLIANNVAEVFEKEITSIYNLENVQVIDKAEADYNPYNIHTARDAIIFALAGFVLSSAIVFIMYYFNNNISSSDMIEKKFGIPVLGNIPLVKGVDK